MEQEIILPLSMGDIAYSSNGTRILSLSSATTEVVMKMAASMVGTRNLELTN